MLDRNLQHKIMGELIETYPNLQTVEQMECFVDDYSFHQNLHYLFEHGLIDGKPHANRSKLQNSITMPRVKITAHGLDFLADDGGLGAILNKVVIKFDDEDLAALILSRVERSDAPPEKKNELMTTIRSLPAEAVKTVYTRLINYGLDSSQDVFQLVKTMMD